jgi:zinc/manganese transport system substrate-binding protein
MRSFVLASIFLLPAVSLHATFSVVAAENFYGGVAHQIGGNQVTVFSILTNPDQDPHLFTVDTATAKAVARADVVIESGIDYDPWMAQLDSAHPSAARTTITVADLVGAKDGDNPHIWYRPDTMPALARKLAALLAAHDPTHAAYFRAQLATFLGTLQPVRDKIAALKARVAGTDVVATEPVFGYMATALGFRMHALDFQNHVMNNVEPTAQETGEFETLLKTHRVKLLFYNGQASDPVATRMEEIARQSGVPVIGVTETEPAGTTYASWMLGQLDEIGKTLGR